MLGRKTITLPTPPITPSISRSRQGTVGNQGVEASADQFDQRADPLLGIGADPERAVEHEPHQHEKDRETPELVRDQRVDHLRGLGLFPLAGGVGLAQGAGDEAVLLVGEGRFDVLAQLLFDAAGLAVGDLLPRPESFATLELIHDIRISLKHFHGKIAGRKVVGELLAEGLEVAVEQPEALLDDRPLVDVDMADAVVLVFIDGDHGVQQRFDAPARLGHNRNHRHAQHASQTVVIEACAAQEQFVVHVERHDHAGVDVDELGSQVKVAFEVGCDHGIDDHVGRLLDQVSANVKLLGGVGCKGIGARQVGDLEFVTPVGVVAPLGIDGHPAVIAHVLVAARYGVE